MLPSQCHLGVDHRIDLFLRNDHFLAELNSHDLIFFATITIDGDKVAKDFSATHVLLVDDADTVNGLAVVTDGDTAFGEFSHKSHSKSASPVIDEVTLSQIHRKLSIRSCFLEYFHVNNHFRCFLINSQIKNENHNRKEITRFKFSSLR